MISVYNRGVNDLHCPFLPFIQSFPFSLIHTKFTHTRRTRGGSIVNEGASAVRKRGNHFLSLLETSNPELGLS